MPCHVRYFLNFIYYKNLLYQRILQKSFYFLHHSRNLNKNSPNPFNPLFLSFTLNFKVYTKESLKSIKIRNKLYNKFFSFPQIRLKFWKPFSIFAKTWFETIPFFIISRSQKVSHETFIMTDFSKNRNEWHVCDKRQKFEGRVNPLSLCNQANYEIVKDAKRLVECESQSSRGSLIELPFYITRPICDQYGIFLCDNFYFYAIIFYLHVRKIIISYLDLCAINSCNNFT